MKDFILFQTFTDSESAHPTVELLTSAGVPVHIDDTRLLYANVLQQTPTLPEVRVMIPAQELGRARALLETHATEAGEMPADHYLHGFSDAELIDLVAKPDEWSAHDYVWAQQLLATRGSTLRPAEMQALRQVRVEQLAGYKPLPPIWRTVGWVAAVLGGIVGIAIGWDFYASRTTLPDGRRVATYAPADQQQGLWMMGVGAVTFLLGLAVKYLW
jgi:hypothetical protein